jgi:hypothetical protein
MPPDYGPRGSTSEPLIDPDGLPDKPVIGRPANCRARPSPNGSKHRLPAGRKTRAFDGQGDCCLVRAHGCDTFPRCAGLIPMAGRISGIPRIRDNLAMTAPLAHLVSFECRIIVDSTHRSTWGF